MGHVYVYIGLIWRKKFLLNLIFVSVRFEHKQFLAFVTFLLVLNLEFFVNIQNVNKKLSFVYITKDCELCFSLKTWRLTLKFWRTIKNALLRHCRQYKRNKEILNKWLFFLAFLIDNLECFRRKLLFFRIFKFIWVVFVLIFILLEEKACTGKAIFSYDNYPSNVPVQRVGFNVMF